MKKITQRFALIVRADEALVAFLRSEGAPHYTIPAIGATYRVTSSASTEALAREEYAEYTIVWVGALGQARAMRGSLSFEEGQDIETEIAAYFVDIPSMPAAYEILHMAAREVSARATARPAMPPEELARYITELAHEFANARDQGHRKHREEEDRRFEARLAAARGERAASKVPA